MDAGEDFSGRHADGERDCCGGCTGKVPCARAMLEGRRPPDEDLRGSSASEHAASAAAPDRTVLVVSGARRLGA